MANAAEDARAPLGVAPGERAVTPAGPEAAPRRP
jgi:hypothetical protein